MNWIYKNNTFIDTKSFFEIFFRELLYCIFVKTERILFRPDPEPVRQQGIGTGVRHAHAGAG